MACLNISGYCPSQSCSSYKYKSWESTLDEACVIRLAQHRSLLGLESIASIFCPADYMEKHSILQMTNIRTGKVRLTASSYVPSCAFGLLCQAQKMILVMDSTRWSAWYTRLDSIQEDRIDTEGHSLPSKCPLRREFNHYMHLQAWWSQIRHERINHINCKLLCPVLLQHFLCTCSSGSWSHTDVFSITQNETHLSCCQYACCWPMMTEGIRIMMDEIWSL